MNDTTKLLRWLECPKKNEEEIYEHIFFVCSKEDIDVNFMNNVLSWKDFYPNKLTKDRETILHILTKYNHINWIDELLKTFDVDIDAKDRSGNTPFLIAAEFGHLEVLELLHTRGADVNCTEYVENSALHLAAKGGRLECLRYLIETVRLDLNLENRYGDSPLLVAANNGHHECCKCLLERGADVYHREKEDGTVLINAAFTNSAECVDVILSYVADDRKEDYVNCANTKEMSALTSAIYNKNPAVVTLLLKAKANVNYIYKGKTMLMLASGIACTEILTTLIENGADLNTKSDTGSTALSFAISKSDVDSVRVLLNAGANANIVDKSDLSPLHWAVKRNDQKIVELLVDPRYGVDLNLLDENGDTPLELSQKLGRIELTTVLSKAQEGRKTCT